MSTAYVNKDTHVAQILRPEGYVDHDIINNNTICNDLEGDSWTGFQFYQERTETSGKKTLILVMVTSQLDMGAREWRVLPCYVDLRSERVARRSGPTIMSIERDELEKLYIGQLKSYIRQLVLKTVDGGEECVTRD